MRFKAHESKHWKYYTDRKIEEGKLHKNYTIIKKNIEKGLDNAFNFFKR